MGCCASHPSNEQVDEYLSGNIGADYFPKDETDISDYHCEGVHGQTIVKKPNDLKGEDFVIENCKDTNIYLMDYTAAVTIDCCEDCQIFIGPCKGSVFIRESKRCVIMASCQQFRVRDSAFCTFYLHCTTQPVIENSMETKFGCFSCYYPELSDQLVKANLSPLNNNWHSVHNFNPDYYNAWRLIRPNDGSLRLRAHEIVSISFYNNNSTIPFTTGSTYPDANVDVCVVMFRNSDHSSRALKFIKEINNLIILVASKEMLMKGTGLLQFFTDNDSSPSVLKDGKVVFLLLQGSNCISFCSEAIDKDQANNSENVYYSPDFNQGQIDCQRLMHIISNSITMT